jgi:hypothetical protein
MNGLAHIIILRESSLIQEFAKKLENNLNRLFLAWNAAYNFQDKVLNA